MKTVKMQTVACRMIDLKRYRFAWLLFLFIYGKSFGVQAQEIQIEIAPVLAHFPVDFSLVTHADMQFVGYYDPEHNMTVASRKLNDTKWNYQILPSKIKWDSHNSITMAVDKEGYLHLSGNMHCQPLIYFRSEKPLDITSFKRVESMTSQREDMVTYPSFMEGPDGNLIFHYRYGGSGNGDEIYNTYDCATKTWSRLLDQPLTDGEGQMNAYMEGPLSGPDHYYHLVWVWRDTYHCETNHHLSYAKSPDLKNWESAAGESVSLPLTIHETRLWVDSIPPKGGIINGAAKLGFDSQDRPLIVYYKFDAAGKTQAYVARSSNQKWDIKRISNWDYRWWFSGGGSINNEINLQAAVLTDRGRLKVAYNHIKYGAGYWILDENTLNVLETVRTGDSQTKLPSQEKTPEAFIKVKRTVKDSGKASPSVYSLEWETLPANRDTLRTGMAIEPSMLYLIEREH